MNLAKEPQMAPYGSWKSPVTSDLIVSGSIRIGAPVLDGQDIYWSEVRPTEQGRSAIVRRTPDGKTTDVISQPFNARTRVHEYGGGAYTVSNGSVYFSNFADNRLYRIAVGPAEPLAEPQPITPSSLHRYADLQVDTKRGRLICVREDHHVRGAQAINTLVSVALDGSEEVDKILVAGNDFYASLCLSPDGMRLAWLTWNHPNMPWDGTELWIGEFQADGSLGNMTRVAGGAEESVFQPEWSPDGVLHFVSDRTGWWNLYRWRNGATEPLHEMAAEFGVPQWVFGQTTYKFVSPERIICLYSEQNIWHLGSLDTTTGKLAPIQTPYTAMASIQIGAGYAVFAAASPTEFAALVRLDLTKGNIEVLRRSNSLTLDKAYFSVPETIEFPTENEQTAFAFFYPPHNPAYAAPTGERPPLLVMVHGGPTAATNNALALETQYWTSRGFAVLDVNYGGSTGYGREYRERLKDSWGIVDIDDCVNGARYLVQRGLVDGARLAITGGSAGGYTTLSVLTFRDLFKTGASYFGVSDIEALAKDTHKFESRYMDSMVGPYPERIDLYHQRSPIHFTDRLSHPVIFFQGLDDKIVPPNQAELMVEALRTKGIPVAYLAFEGEGHGFRRAENIKRSLEAELYFFSRVFGFEPADTIEPVKIENM